MHPLGAVEGRMSGSVGERGSLVCHDSRAPSSMPSGWKLPWGIPKSGPNNIACVHAKLLQSCPTLCDPWTVACQAPLFMGFSRQEHWSGLPCLPPVDLPDSGIKHMFPVSSASQADSLPIEPPGKSLLKLSSSIITLDTDQVS